MADVDPHTQATFAFAQLQAICCPSSRFELRRSCPALKLISRRMEAA